MYNRGYTIRSHDDYEYRETALNAKLSKKAIQIRLTTKLQWVCRAPQTTTKPCRETIKDKQVNKR